MIFVCVCYLFVCFDSLDLLVPLHFWLHFLTIFSTIRTTLYNIYRLMNTKFPFRVVDCFWFTDWIDYQTYLLIHRPSYQTYLLARITCKSISMCLKQKSWPSTWNATLCSFPVCLQAPSGSHVLYARHCCKHFSCTLSPIFPSSTLVNLIIIEFQLMRHFP